MNFAGLELYLWLILIGYMLYKTKGKLIGTKANSFISICVFFVIYTLMLLIKGHSYLTSVLTYLVCPIGAYSLGYWFVRRDNINRISIFLVSISIGRGMHGLLNMLPYIFEGYTARNPIDFWSKHVIAATGAGTLFVLAVSLIYYSVYTMKNSKPKGLTLLLFCSLCVLSAIYIGTRGCLLIAAITCAVNIICFTNLGNKDARRTIFTFIIVFAFIIVSYNFNFFNLRTIFENSGLYRRLFIYKVAGFEDNERWKLQANMIRHLFDYPFGAENQMYAHNLWLDVARLTGIAPFFLSIAMTYTLMKTAFKCIISQYISKELRIIFLSLIVGIFIVFFIEPVLEGSPSLFILFIMICSMCGKVKQIELIDKNVMNNENRIDSEKRDIN